MSDTNDRLTFVFGLLLGFLAGVLAHVIMAETSLGASLRRGHNTGRPSVGDHDGRQQRRTAHLRVRVPKGKRGSR